MKVYELPGQRGRYLGVVYRERGAWCAESRDFIKSYHDTQEEAVAWLRARVTAQ